MPPGRVSVSLRGHVELDAVELRERGEPAVAGRADQLDLHGRTGRRSPRWSAARTPGGCRPGSTRRPAGSRCVGCSRTPPIAIASAPAAHRSLTSSWMSRSRMTPPVARCPSSRRRLVEHDPQPGPGDRGDLPGVLQLRRRSAAGRPRRAPTGWPAAARPGRRPRRPAPTAAARARSMSSSSADRVFSARGSLLSVLLADDPEQHARRPRRPRPPRRRARPPVDRGGAGRRRPPRRLAPRPPRRSRGRGGPGPATPAATAPGCGAPSAAAATGSGAVRGQPPAHRRSAACGSAARAGSS